MAAKSPAFQFYAADYLADEDVALMTLEEEGAYIRAISYCWREGSIPADTQKLSRLLKGASNQTVTVVRSCFEPSANDGSRLVHPRLEKEREKQAGWKQKSAEAGKLSGKVRREKKLHAEPTFENGSHLVEPKTNSSSSFSSSSSEQVSEANASSPRRAADGDAVDPLEAIYAEYPRKEAKRAALKAIAGAVDRLRKGEVERKPISRRDAQVFLFRRVQCYARSPAGLRADKTLIPHPATWFNQSRYLDDDTNWQNTGGADGRINANIQALKDSIASRSDRDGADAGSHDARGEAGQGNPFALLRSAAAGAA